ncbi:MAG: pitrilysin family protein [Armatimonadota bacterium]|jgi:zinc protease
MAATVRSVTAVSRRRRKAAFAFALLPLALAGGGSPTAVTSQAVADTTTTVAYDVDGLHVVQRIVPGSHVVAVRLFLLGGTRQLTAETAGIEALLLRAVDLATQLDMARAGGRTIRSIGADWSVTGFLSLRQDFDSVWATFAGRFPDPPLSDAAVTRARAELVTDAQRRNTHPDLRISEIAQLVAFPEHPYGIEPHGTTESLAGLTRADVERYTAEHLVRSRMLLVVVGAVSQQELASRVAATLGRLPRGAYEWTLPPRVPVRRRSWLTEHRLLPTNYILGYFAGPPPSDGDYFGFRAATELLSAFIARAVRDQRSLSYAAYAPFLDRAIPIGGIYASTQQPADVYRAIQEAVADLRADEVHPEALRRFLSQFTLDELRRRMTSDGQADALGRAQLYFGDYRVADDYVRRLRSIRPLDVRRAARRYMEHIQLAYLGDTTRMEGRW